MSLSPSLPPPPPPLSLSQISLSSSISLSLSISLARSLFSSLGLLRSHFFWTKHCNDSPIYIFFIHLPGYPTPSRQCNYPSCIIQPFLLPSPPTDKRPEVPPLPQTVCHQSPFPSLGTPTSALTRFIFMCPFGRFRADTARSNPNPLQRLTVIAQSNPQLVL